jgi:antibiotic biosynthesis monooxygenase (ABM) superfamily enzyme
MKKTKLQASLQPVTVVFSWQVLDGQEEAFTNWVHGISKEASRWPGHLGVTTLRPPKGKGTYHSVLRFDTDEHLSAWLESSERHKWIDQLQGIATAHSRKATGMESWFDLPAMTGPPPPKWKMVIATFIGVYPLSILLGAFVSPHIVHWNLFVRALLFPIVAPILLTYVMLPFLTQRVLRRWLYKAT